MNLSVVLLILVVLFVFGGGGFYAHRASWGGSYGGPGIGLLGIVVILVLLFGWR